MKPSESCIETSLACMAACERCVTYCMASGNKGCISLCRDCADICALCARFEARGSLYAKELHEIAAKICKACSVECEKHASHNDSCKECAEACKKYAAICDELS